MAMHLYLTHVNTQPPEDVNQLIRLSENTSKAEVKKKNYLVLGFRGFLFFPEPESSSTPHSSSASISSSCIKKRSFVFFVSFGSFFVSAAEEVVFFCALSFNSFFCSFSSLKRSSRSFCCEQSES